MGYSKRFLLILTLLVVPILLNYQCSDEEPSSNSITTGGDTCNDPIPVDNIHMDYDTATGWYSALYSGYATVKDDWHIPYSDCSYFTANTYDDLYFIFTLSVPTYVSFTALSTKDNLLLAIFPYQCPDEPDCIKTGYAEEGLGVFLEPSVYLAVVFDDDLAGFSAPIIIGFKFDQALTRTAEHTPNVSIPDAGNSYSYCGLNGGASDTITISKTGTIAKVQVGIIIEHTSISDLDIFIQHEDKCVELATDVGFFAQDYGDPTNLDWSGAVIFDDSATSSIVWYSGGTTGIYKPEGTLSAFESEEMSGDWTIYVYDDDSGTIGTLKWWGLRIYYY